MEHEQQKGRLRGCQEKTIRHHAIKLKNLTHTYAIMQKPNGLLRPFSESTGPVLSPETEIFSRMKASMMSYIFSRYKLRSLKWRMDGDLGGLGELGEGEG